MILRIVSSVIMAGAAILLTGAGTLPFAGLVAGVASTLCWEWGRMVRKDNPTPPLVLHVAATLFAVALSAAGEILAAMGVLFVGAVLLALTTKPALARSWSAAGAVYFGLPAVALIAMRQDAVYGIAAVLFLFTVVWGADTFAYFTGRAIGGPKLAPSISPGKTWAGLFGGVILPSAICAAAATWIGGTSPFAIALLAATLACISQVGDLVESYAKRQFRQKDASHLIPGHGGFLDRVDGFIFASVAAWLFGLVRDPGHPAQALLLWP
ncbi:MAG: phosphatidate cytidylyltransferase [Pseudomonadota bacterium]|nr:phosphatidate cytidylyltransferase [Pseudomonadota bacterium]